MRNEDFEKDSSHPFIPFILLLSQIERKSNIDHK